MNEAAEAGVQPVILCGGSGSRLWPLSREQYPKQLLHLVGERSLLQAAALRLAGDEPTSLPPILVGNEAHRFLIARQLRDCGIEGWRLILEPCGRNTAPALTLAALAAGEGGADPVLVVMPADHLIADEPAFLAAIQAARPLAERGLIVTLGVQPTRADTGYGYLRLGQKLPAAAAWSVAQFVEKPDGAAAARYVASGDYAWNSGIFILRASVWLEKLAACQPAMRDVMHRAWAGRRQDGEFLRPDAREFERCPADSVDYAVLEKLPAGEIAVVPLAAGWSDLGTWSALWENGDKDAAGNLLVGDVIGIDLEDTLAMAQGRLVACIGVSGLVVVETPDAVLVAERSRIQDVKKLVGNLKSLGRCEGLAHRKVHRPWGWYDCIDGGQRFQVKRIVVEPGASLSLQMHHHRAEHWIVVRGTARVTRGEEVFLVAENQSAYIPIGTPHRLENPGKLPLEMIEVQSGSYLGEDDIVRFDDAYGRGDESA